MNSVAVIFTHPPDYPAAIIASRCMERHGVKVVWVIDHDSTLEGVPAERDVVLSYAPRNGNLLGAVWVAEQLRVMEEVSQGYDWVIKLDSDTIVTSMKWLEAARPEHQIVGTYYDYHAGTKKFLCGQCYAIRSTAVPSLRLSERIKHPAYVGVNEDTTIGGMLPESQRLQHEFHDRKGMLSGWLWTTDREAAYWIERYEVLTIQRDTDSGRDIDDMRADVLAVMLWLEESSLQTLQIATKPPSLLKRAKTLSKAIVAEGKAIAAGEERLTDSEITSRLTVCGTCPEFRESTKTCGICFCYLPAKTRFRTQHCPAGKW